MEARNAMVQQLRQKNATRINVQVCLQCFLYGQIRFNTAKKLRTYESTIVFLLATWETEIGNTCNDVSSQKLSFEDAKFECELQNDCVAVWDPRVTIEGNWDDWYEAGWEDGTVNDGPIRFFTCTSIKKEYKYRSLIYRKPKRT